MNINKMITKGIVNINEINRGISMEEIAPLRQALERRAEEDQKLKNAVQDLSEEDQKLKVALQDLRKILETEQPSAAKATAFRLLENFSVSTLANALGGSVLTIIQKLAGM